MPLIKRVRPQVRNTVDTTPIKKADTTAVGGANATGTSTGVTDAKTVDPTAGMNVPTAGSDAAGSMHLDGQLNDLGITDKKKLRAGLAGALHAVADAAPADAPTAPSIQKLYNDPDFKQLYTFATSRMQEATSGGRGWDKLWQVEGFATAANFVLKGAALDGSAAVSDKPLFSKFGGAQERRALCHLLLLMMPEESRTERPMNRDGSRAAPQSLFEPFPDAMIAAADSGFPIQAGDIPSVNPIFTQHLSRGDVIEKVFQKGQNGTFLASKKFCPGAFVQDRKDVNPSSMGKHDQVGHEGDPIFVKIDDVIEVDGKKMAKVHVEAQFKQWMGPGGGTQMGHEVLGQIDVVTDKQGKPVLGPDGKPQDILIPVEHLADYMLDPGTGRGAKGLDMGREEDRAIALAYTSELKGRFLTDSNGYTKSLFDWLEQGDARTPPKDLERIKLEVRDAAWHSVAKHACHPRRTHFKLDLETGPGGAENWQHQAYELLNDTGMMQDVGNRYEKDKASTQNMHEMAWTAKFLSRGFVGGSLDCYGLADAFDRLQATFLAPLGIISKTNVAEGHGSELTRTLSNPDENGVIQGGEIYKSKLNEMITAVDARISSGRGPAAEYMENWPGYLKVEGPTGRRLDFAELQARLDDVASST